jgi:hypothetical protein
VAIEILQRARLAVALQIVGRGVGVEMDREQAPPDEIRLHGFAHAQRDIRLAHAEVEFLVGEDRLEMNLGIELEKLAELGRQPVGADAERRRHPQFAMRLVAAVSQARLHGRQFQHHVAHRAQQHLALFGEDEPARMPVEQRHFEILLERAHLTADGGLAEPQRLAGMGEGASVRGGLKDPQLVPIHDQSSLRACPARPIIPPPWRAPSRPASVRRRARPCSRARPP